MKNKKDTLTAVVVISMAVVTGMLSGCLETTLRNEAYKRSMDKAS